MGNGERRADGKQASREDAREEREAWSPPPSASLNPSPGPSRAAGQGWLRGVVPAAPPRRRAAALSQRRVPQPGRGHTSQRSARGREERARPRPPASPGQQSGPGASTPPRRCRRPVLAGSRAAGPRVLPAARRLRAGAGHSAERGHGTARGQPRVETASVGAMGVSLCLFI